MVTGTRYYYAVSAVDAAGNEGPKSTESSAIAIDNIPPELPKDLSAVGGTKQVVLNWTANTEPDLAGYDVYRDGVKVNGAIVTGTTFTDTGLADSTTYAYTLTASDIHGNASAPCTAVSATTSAVAPPSAANLVDYGFENGTVGTNLVNPPWAGVSGTPLHREYSNAEAKVGSQSAWIVGPSNTNNAGPWETASAGMTSNGAEYRFWLYTDSTNQQRLVDDYALGVALEDRAFGLALAADGAVKVLVNRAGNPNGYSTGAYTPVGTYTTGWTQYRIVLTFTGTNAQTYTLSKRAGAADDWTQLKAAGATGYAIPFRGSNTILHTHGTLWRGNNSSQLWLDELEYSNDGITVPVTYTITSSVGGGGSIAPVGVQTVASGADSANFVITPDSGYMISDVLVDGLSVGRPGSYKFTNVVANHTIAATFAADLPSGDEMPLPAGTDCDDCHGSYHNNDYPPCAACHDGYTAADFAGAHPGTGSELHTPATITGCTSCHRASLTIEHNGRKTVAGDDINCFTCHQSADPKVTTAIATGNSACDACHDMAGTHVAAHDGGFTDPSCASCHSQNISTQHADDCDKCHQSTDPVVIAAIAAQDTTCGACHVDSPSHESHHDNALPDPSCGGCHDSNASKEHSDNCDLCHKSTNPIVLQAIVDGNVSCASCHKDIHPDYLNWDPPLADGPGPHAGYMTTTTTCRVCHSTHRAAGDGTKLLPTNDTTCGGCHTGGSAVSARTVTWAEYDINWTPQVDPGSPLAPLGSENWMNATGAERKAAIINQAAAGGGGGPHNASAVALIENGLWN
ncbi:MAG: cytochrome c3 family protein, partial [Actinomycetes bacterium]